MNYRMIVRYLGWLLLLEAVMLLLPLALCLGFRESLTMLVSYLGTMAGLLLLGGAASFRKPKNTAIYAKEGLVIVGLSWILMSAFGALPFVFSGYIPQFVDAFFEVVSGFTTTGATILTDIEALPKSLLMWRSFTHWVGGMGVLVLMLAILPRSESNYLHIMRAEMPGVKVGKLSSKIRMTGVILYGIYFALCIAEVIFLLCGGMSLYDAVLHTFSTAGTGGFSCYNDSIAHFANAGYAHAAYLEYVITVFMILFGINFNLYYFILLKRFHAVLFNEELRYYLGMILAAAAVITWNTYSLYTTLESGIRHALFQVASIITTTGFVTFNYDTWPSLSRLLLLLLMFVGSCAGSTGGGLKVSRVLLLCKEGRRELRRQIRPRIQQSVKLDGKAVERETLRTVGNYFFLFMAVAAVSVMLVALDGKDIITSITSVMTCMNNVGPGLGDVVGAVGNFASLSVLSKLVLIFDMLAGRLELIPILSLLSVTTWRR